MFDYYKREKSLVAKLLVTFAVGMAVGFGLCGVGFLSGTAGSRAAGYIIAPGAILFFLCLAGILITAIVVFVIKIVGYFRK